MDHKIWCMKCRNHTQSHDVKLAKTNTNRPLLLAKCGQCGLNKTRFISKDSFQQAQRGEGLLSGLLGFKNGFPLLNQIPILGQLL